MPGAAAPGGAPVRACSFIILLVAEPGPSQEPLWRRTSRDPDRLLGSLWDVVRDRRLNHRPEVVSGVLAGESTALLHAFFATHR